jgi:hypothetical protein
VLLDADPWVDDKALLALRGGHDIAVRREGERGKADDQHLTSLDGRHGVLLTGAASTQERAGRRLD